MNKVFACRAIFFDAGNTLFHPYPSVGAVYARVGSRYGLRQPPEVLEERFHKQWQTRGGLASLTGPATPALEKLWWKSLVQDVFSEIAPGETFEKFFDDLYHSFGHAENWRVYPEVEAVLKDLKARGFRMGIISNWDSRLFDLCREMGLEPYFEFILVSAVIGHSKPGARIFQDALKLADCQPAQAVHVGDSYEDDYRAALGAGLEAVYLDRRGRHAPEGDVCRIKDLRELQACVRLV